MTAVSAADQPMQLVVFSDDWGRHPSSCQHLVRHLLPRVEVVWVNTIGTRRPSLAPADLGKIVAKLGQWLRPGPAVPRAAAQADGVHRAGPAGPRVVSPPMYPGFRRAWQRGLNAHLMARRVAKVLGPRQPGVARAGLTTLPVTADLVGRLDVDRWVYYCVDDFSAWPGLDGAVMDAMERKLVGAVDAIVAVSETLQRRMADFGREDVTLLTHGIDPEHWHPREGMEAAAEQVAEAALPEWWTSLQRPIALFWGVVDPRLDVDLCLAIAREVGSLVLAGPRQGADRALSAAANIVMPGAVDYSFLPRLAAAADCLVMPYADLPVTRAMQPLKLKEYLATGRPAIVRELPATRPWVDAADVVSTVEEAVAALRRCLEEGVPPTQQRARRRLADETWSAKAQCLWRLLTEREKAACGQHGDDAGPAAGGPLESRERG